MWKVYKFQSDCKLVYSSHNVLVTCRHVGINKPTSTLRCSRTSLLLQYWLIAAWSLDNCNPLRDHFTVTRPETAAFAREIRLFITNSQETDIILKKYVLHYLLHPTSVGSERVFSASGLFLTKRRCKKKLAYNVKCKRNFVMSNDNFNISNDESLLTKLKRLKGFNFLFIEHFFHI